MAEGAGASVIVREKGHYYGNCIFFDPPDMAPVGMDNKVRKNKHSLFHFHYISMKKENIQK